MTQKKTKRSLNGEQTSLNVTNQEADLNSVARIMASLIIGIQPFMDISLLQLMLQDVFSEPLSEEQAQEMGEEIYRRCRTTLPTDGLGGVH